MLATFAERAQTLDYTAPKMCDETRMQIEAGRHPVVETKIQEDFVANDLRLDEQQRMLMVTGPNMGGKSTVMRQCALIALLAHAGSFVPAKSATISVMDRIFTRVGSSDDLARGRSTFMVEMTEMARIIHEATPKSLVIVDEIGRGTSTNDGLAIAWACARELALENRSLTLFATHYFELTKMEGHTEGVANVHLPAIENGERITFMYEVRKGPANESYGIAVAGLAGMPKRVLENAKRALKKVKKSG